MVHFKSFTFVGNLYIYFDFLDIEDQEGTLQTSEADLIELRRLSLSTPLNLSPQSYECDYNTDYSEDDPTFNPNEYESGDYQENIEPENNNIENNHNEENVVSVNVEKNKRPRQKRKKPENWKMNVRKQKRNSGLEYVTTSGKLRLPRFPKNINHECNCKIKCHEKLNDDAKAEIFKNFWDLGNVDLQRGFICKHVKRHSSARSRKEDSRRKFSQTYYLPFKGIEHKVCKLFFLKTLDISEKMTRTALAKSERNVACINSPDKRGHHPPGNKLSTETVQFAEEHINSFPRVPAHWCRKDSTKEYLEPILNKRKMYNLYKEKCLQHNNMKSISETSYREILFKKNIGFHIPRKDQCWCHNFEQLPEAEKSEGLEKYNLHLKCKEAANKEKRNDAERASSDRSYCSVNFDLEAVLYCPLFYAKPIFYKRKLANFNFTIYSVSDKKGYCYFWTEHEGKRGSNEIATCLMSFIQQLPDHVKHLSLFSDCCSGQNRNAIVACMLQQAVIQSKNVEIIDLKFLEPGHTHMECDSMHATIEAASEYAKIFVPNDWYNIIKLAKKTGKPYDVTHMHFDDVYDYKKLKDIIMTNVNKAESGDVLNWKEVKWLRFQKATPNLMLYKTNFWDAEFQVIRTTKRRGRAEVALARHACPKAYNGYIPLNKKKYEDIISMCDSKPPLIEPSYHSFYKSLPYESEDDSDNQTLATIRASLLKRKRKRNNQ